MQTNAFNTLLGGYAALRFGEQMQELSSVNCRYLPHLVALAAALPQTWLSVPQIYSSDNLWRTADLISRQARTVCLGEVEGRTLG